MTHDAVARVKAIVMPLANRYLNGPYTRVGLPTVRTHTRTRTATAACAGFVRLMIVS